MKNQRRKLDRGIRLTEFSLPPIQDGLVGGRLLPIGHVAVGKALSLLSFTAFTHIPIEDEVIADVLVRAAILRKLSEEAVCWRRSNR